MALKKCKECGKEVSTKASKCPNCGTPIKKTPWGWFGVIALVVIIGSWIGSSPERHSSTIKPGKTKSKSPDFDEIRRLMRENRDLAQKIAQAKVNANLEIEKGWTWQTTLGEDYSYIRGRVKNTGDTIIRYFEVVAVYKDAKGNILDTDYTNSGEILRPGWSKEFEIMHRDRKEYKKVSIYVQNVH